MNKKNNILICPLEWGLGHASRIIPLAKKLRESDNNVFIASGDDHLAFLHAELPEIFLISFPGFKTNYSRSIPQYLHLLSRIPSLLYHIFREHHRIKKIIAEFDIDILISDNRFGLWNNKITTVYITHMPLIPFPKSLKFLEPVGKLLHSFIIRKYTFCFIPDLPGDLNVSGRLSHGIYPSPGVRYVGILSRFTDYMHSNETVIQKPHITVLLSGPEPQREMLKQKLTGILKNKDLPTYMFEGKPRNSTNEPGIGNITFYNHLDTSQLKEIIVTSEWIITRSGYSTIMDLLALGKTATLIPTPGQTEQEYLAEYLTGKGWFSTVSQDKLNENILPLKKEMTCNDEILKLSRLHLDSAIKELLEYQHKKSKTEKPGRQS